MLIGKQKYIISVLLILLIFFGTNLTGYANITPVKDRTPQVRDAIAAAVPGVTDAADVTEAHLAAITSLNLRGKGISMLKTDDFSGMTALTSINLYNNQLSSLPDDIFKGLTSLTTIRLGRNAVDPLPFTISLEKVADDQFKAVAPTGALFNTVLPITVANGTIIGGATTVTIPHGSVESGTLTVTRTAGTTTDVTVDIGTLPSLPRNHFGYALVKSDTFPLTVITGTNTAPVFTDGISTSRSIAENTAANTNIGTAIAATDADSGDTLTYTLGGTDAASFSIVSTTGQLQTNAALDYETKTSYTVSVSVSDGNGGSETITVTINVTDVNEQQPATVTYNVGEDIPTLPSGFWTPDKAANGASFQFSNGQITLTFNNEGYIEEDGTTYTCVAAGGCEIVDGQVTQGTIEATAGDTVTPVEPTRPDTNTAPVFTEGASTTRAIPENTVANTNIGTTIAATDADAGDTLTYTVSGPDAAAFSINSTTGQLQTKTTLDYETKSSYSVTVSVSDSNGGSGSIDVTINITDANDAPVFSQGDTLTVTTVLPPKGNIEGDYDIGDPLFATDADGDSVTYRLSGTDAGLFHTYIFSKSVVGQRQNYAQLTTRGWSLHDANKSSFTVIVTASDRNGGSDSITVSINVTDETENTAPVFTDGTTTTRSIAENTASGQHIGTVVAATDADNDTLTYTLSGNPDAATFGIDATTGQLKTKAALDYETKSSYTVTVTVSDGSLTDTITVTINITDIADTPVVSGLMPVSQRTPQVRDAIVAAVPGVNSAANVTAAHLARISSLNLRAKGISALKVGDFDGLSALRELELAENQLRALPTEIFSGLSSLRFLYLNNNQLTLLPEKLFEGVTALEHLYMNTNQLTRLPEKLFNGLVSLRQINLHTNRLTNLPPKVFSGLPSLLEIFLRNNQLTEVPADVFSGLPLIHLYLDGNRLTDLPADVFSGLSSLTSLLLNNNQMSTLPTGVFRGLTASTRLWLHGNTVDPLPLIVSLEKVGTKEFKAVVGAGAPFRITLPLSVANGSISGGATTLTIPQGSVESGTLSVTRTPGTTAEVTVDIGTLPGLPANHQGYKPTKSANLPLTVISSPGNSAPVFTDGTTTTRTVAENTATGIHIGLTVTATDADNDTLNYTLSGTDAATFGIDATDGQLKTKSALDYETKNSYTVIITVSDGRLSDTITVTINVTDIDELPTSTGICKVGDVLAPGESCTYPDTDAVFSVLDNGNSQWNIPNFPWFNKVAIGGSISFTADINNENYHFVAKAVGNNSWEIEEIADDTGQQPETPEQPGDTGGTPTLSISTAAPLTEATLHGGVITFNLSSGTFESSNFRIRDAVSVSGINGVTVDTFSVDRVSDTQATVELEYDGNMTANGTLTVSVGAGAIQSYNGAALTSQIAISAVTESVTASTAAPLTEATLDESVITLTLTGRQFEGRNSTIRSAVSVTGISGVTVRSIDIDRQSDTEVTVELTYDGDMTANGRLTLTVGPDAIAGYNGPALTDQVSVSASTDAPVEPSTPIVTEKPVESDYDHIEGPWLWMIAPGGDIDIDNLSEASEGVITEPQIAQNGVNEGDHFNELQWTSGRLRPTTVCGVFLCSSDNVINVVRQIGLTDSEQLNSYSAYALINIFSPRTQNDVLMGVGSDDSIKVWLNGSVVYENDVSRRTTGIQNRFPVNLNAGDNLLLIKVCNHSALISNNDWGMFFKLYLDAQDYTVSLPAGGTGGQQPDNTGGTPTLSASTAAPLTEATLHGGIITLNLSGGTFERSSFRIRDAVSVSGISGVTVRSFDIDRESDTEVTVELTYDGDMTTDGTLTLTVGAGAIAGYDGPALTAQVAVSAGDAPADTGGQNPDPPETPEQPGNTGGTPTLSVSTAAPLTEATLHGSIITLNLSSGAFESSSFRIRDAVSVSGINGVTVDTFGVDRVGDTQVTIELEYAGNIDVDGTLTFTVGAEAIKDYDGSALTAQIRVTANTESVVASVVSPLTEATLDDSVVTLTLSGAKFASSIFDIRDGVTVSGINGVTKPWNQPQRKSDTELTVKLEFDGTDFDTTATLTFTVEADSIAGYNGPALTTQISVSAVVESVVASSASPLKEATLDGSVVTLTLGGAKFASSIFDIRDAVTVSGINGVTKPWNQPKRKSDTEITVELEFDGDMTTDGTLIFTVGADAIAGYNGPALTTQIAVTADRENALLANFPNPFNPETWIPYQLAKPTEVTITIYNINGHVVRTLELGHQTAGVYQTRSRAAYWDGKNVFGEKVASGLYFYTLTTGDFTATRKMLIRK